MDFLGSSPHTRDKYEQVRFEGNREGIIPAYAGQMLHPLSYICAVEDHPRIRGTNIVKVLSVINLVGSSPHTRDKFLVAALNKLSTGIIPAYAGQILLWGNGFLHVQDHPRIRGTNLHSL